MRKIPLNDIVRIKSPSGEWMLAQDKLDYQPSLTIAEMRVLRRANDGGRLPDEALSAAAKAKTILGGQIESFKIF